MKERLRWAAGVLILLAAVLSLLFAASSMAEQEASVHLDELAARVKAFDQSGLLEQMMEEQTPLEVERDHLWVLSAGGEVLYSAGKERNADPAAAEDVLLARQSNWDCSSSETVEGVKLLAESFRRDDGTIVRVQTEMIPAHRWITETGSQMWYRFVCLEMLVAVLALLLVQRLVKPVQELAEHPEDMPQERIYPELRPYIETIRQQRQDIEKNMRMREVYSANLTHELKTPVAAVMGYAEELSQGGCSDEEQVRYGGEIRRNAERLQKMIENVLCLSELDLKEESTFRREKVSLTDLAEMCVDSLQETARKNEVQLHFRGVPCTVDGDASLLELLVYNLVSNGIRYNHPGGSVTVTVDRGITVEDTGIGIPREDLPHIFERFYRVDKQESRKRGGSGLGLAIVKSIADLHKAELTVESEVGKGSRFQVRFRA